MVEPIMYFGIGFLIATLIGLVVMPLVHRRAVGLTMRRIDAATPLSMAEVQADKDQLRAEFAMSTRRLEMSLEQLRSTSGAQLAELGKKGDAINRLMIEIGEKTTTILALEAREKASQDQLRSLEEELATKSHDLFETQVALSEKEAELAKLAADLEDQTTLGNSQKIEIVALNARVEALNDALQSAERELKEVEIRRDAERVEFQSVTQDLLEARKTIDDFVRRTDELEQALASKVVEAKKLDEQKRALEGQLGQQANLLADNDFELNLLRNDLKNARNIENELHAAITKLEHETADATQRLTTENIRLRTDLIRMEDERGHLAHEVSKLKREAEEKRDAEQENAALRERINDVAVEVARLASTLESSSLSVEGLLAVGPIREQAVSSTPSRTAYDVSARANPEDDLAERMRALKSLASRAHRENLKASN